MNVRVLSLNLFALSTFLGLASTATPASAQCVMTDVSVQVALRGSKQPARQSNSVDMKSQGACVGNTSTHTNAQVYVGGGNVTQQRTSTHRLVGGTKPPAGVAGPTVAVPVEVKVDVYNPAERLITPGSSR